VAVAPNQMGPPHPMIVEFGCWVTRVSVAQPPLPNVAT
jgi:hypothetical protein